MQTLNFDRNTENEFSEEALEVSKSFISLIASKWKWIRINKRCKEPNVKNYKNNKVCKPQRAKP